MLYRIIKENHDNDLNNKYYGPIKYSGGEYYIIDSINKIKNCLNIDLSRHYLKNYFNPIDKNMCENFYWNYDNGFANYKLKDYSFQLCDVCKINSINIKKISITKSELKIFNLICSVFGDDYIIEKNIYNFLVENNVGIKSGESVNKYYNKLYAENSIYIDDIPFNKCSNCNSKYYDYVNLSSSIDLKEKLKKLNSNIYEIENIFSSEINGITYKVKRFIYSYDVIMLIDFYMLMQKKT